MKKITSIILLFFLSIFSFATDSTVTVKPSGQGGDYTTVDAALSDQLTNWPDLTTDCNDTGSAGILTISIEGTGWSADTDGWLVSNGFTTSSSYYIKIVADSNNKAQKDEWKTDRYRVDASGDSEAVYIRSDYCVLDGIQIRNTVDSNFDNVYKNDDGDGVTIRNCRFESIDSLGNRAVTGIWIESSHGASIYNNIISGQSSYDHEACSGIFIENTGAGMTNIWNNSIQGFYQGIYNSDTANTVDIQNNAVFDNNDDVYDAGASSINVDYNCADDDLDTEFSESNNVQPYGSDWDNEVADEANGDYTIVDSGNSVAAGIYNPGSGAYSTDMEGDTRAGSVTPSWDIGVDETDTTLRYVDTDAGGTGDGQSWTNAYTTLQGWETGEEANLTTLGKISKVLCRASSGTADTTQCVISTWTTSASYYILVEAESGDEAVKTGWDTNRYRLELSDTLGSMYILENYVRLNGLQIKATYSASTSYAIRYNSIDASNDLRIDSCYVLGSGGGSGEIRLIKSDDADVILKIFNTIVTDAGTSGSNNSGIDVNSSASGTVIYNCTVYDGYYGIVGNDTNTVAKNVAVFNNTDDFALMTTIEYCATDDSQAGTGNIQPASWANEFSNAAGGNFTLVGTGAECYHAGANNPSSGIYTTDMEGDAYNTGTDGSAYSIGVDEYIGAITWRHHTTLGFAMVFDFIYSVLALYKAHMWIVFSVWAFMAVWATIKFIGRDR